MDERDDLQNITAGKEAKIVLQDVFFGTGLLMFAIAVPPIGIPLAAIVWTTLYFTQPFNKKDD